MQPALQFKLLSFMIIDFNSRLPRFAKRLTKIIGVGKVLQVLCLLLNIASFVNAQVSTNARANYKRPYDVEKNRNVPGNEGQFIVTTSAQDRRIAKDGCTWRYHSTPAELIIAIDSKIKTGKKPPGLRPNYKAQF